VGIDYLMNCLIRGCLHVLPQPTLSPMSVGHLLSYGRTNTLVLNKKKIEHQDAADLKMSNTVAELNIRWIDFI